MHFHLHLLLSSDYIVSLSMHAVASQLKQRQLVVLPVALPQLYRTVGIITREHYRMRPEAKNLIKCIESVCRELA